MSEPRAVLQVTGRLPAPALTRVTNLVGTCSVQTLLRLEVRDEAELQGLLRRLHDLALDLVEIRPLAEGVGPRLMEATVTGPIGDLALDSLTDYVEIQQTATRIRFEDSASMSLALGELVTGGMAVEYASALPTPGTRPQQATNSGPT